MASKKGNQTSAGSGAGGSSGNDPDEIAVLKAILADFQAREAARQFEMERLGGVVQQLTQVNSIECILANGFEELSNKLAPLDDLAPKREPLDEDQALRMAYLLEALERPKWSGATSLPVPNRPVHPIGAKVPPHCEGSLAS
jgi:hypothetical protein